MKKYILLILLLCSVCAQAQSYYDSLNINYAEKLLNEDIPLLSDNYIIFIDIPYCMIAFEEDNQYKLYYYEQVFDFKKQQNVFALKDFETEKVRKKSMLHQIFNQSDCISEFIPDSLVIISIYPNKVFNIFSYVEFYNSTDLLSEKALRLLVTEERKKAWTERGCPLNAVTMSGSHTKQTNKGSFSGIVVDDISPNDYYNENTQMYGKNPAGNCTITLHEIIGHGRSLSVDRGDANQHEDAILFENLLLRIVGYSYIQRTGKDHDQKQILQNPSKKPEFR